MRFAAVLLLLPLASNPASAQTPHHRMSLDSGAVVRLTWRGDQPLRATLLSPLHESTDTVHFCRYPSPGCGLGSVNPVRARPVAGLERIEVRKRGAIGRRTLIGAGIGALWGVFAAELVEALGETSIGTGRKMFIVGVSAASAGGIGALFDAGSDRWVDPPSAR